MFFNCNGLNYSTILTGHNPVLDSLSNYDSVEIYGGSDGCIIDKLWGRNIPLSVSIIEHYNSDNYIPKWTTGETYMLAEYNNELDAGNVKGIKGTIEYWNIYRKKRGEDKLVFLKQLPRDAREYIDYTATRNNEYEYYLFAETKTEWSQPAISDRIKSQYYGYFMIDTQNDIIFKINANVTNGNQVFNMNYTQYDTNTKYPSINLGNTRYMSSNAAGLIADQSGINRFDNPVSLLMAFRDFVYSKNSKLLKTPKGEIFNVFISDYTEAVINSSIANVPMLSQFNYTEIGPVDEDNN